MLKTTRWATLAALLMVAAAAAVTPLVSQAQGQPAPAPTPVPAAAPAPAAALAAATVPAAKTNGAKGTEVVENPYGLDALWRGSDWVAKGTLGRAGMAQVRDVLEVAVKWKKARWDRIEDIRV